MSDLQGLPSLLAHHGQVRTPPCTAVVSRAHRIRARRTWAGAMAVLALAGALSVTVLSAAPDVRERRERVGNAPSTSTTTPPAVDSPAGTEGGGVGARSSPEGDGPDPTGGGNPAPAGPAKPLSALECRAGANGGATGVGVTATRINLLAGAQLDGPAKSITAGVVPAWKAVFDKVNRAGGICGRQINLKVVSSLFARQHDFGKEDVLGMLVGPFDRDFDARAGDGSLDRWALPAVGSDGGARAHFSSSWGWPVGTPTPALVRIAVAEAYAAGARTFALVYDGSAAWGREAAAAFSQYVPTLAGAEVRTVQPLDPDAPSYALAAEEFNSRCGSQGCDGVVLALLPDTARKWWARQPTRAAVRAAALGWMYSDRTAQDCVMVAGEQCDGLYAWLSFTPPLPGLRDDPDVREYADDTDSSTSPFTANGYVAAKVLVAALRQAGPNLSRESLRRALDEMTYSSGLVSRLDWGPRLPTDRVGNTSARAVRAEVAQGTFRQWVDAGTGWVRDPWPGSFPD